MKKQQPTLKDLPHGYYMQKLLNSPTFKWLKVEMEGNQYSYDVDDDPESYEEHIMDNAGVSRGDFQYIQAYNDGSVNTEITFTVPLNSRGLDVTNQMLRAFGNDMENVDNAGMHLTLMPERPYRDDEPELNPEGVANLKREIEPILPFIQLLGQSEPFHRGAHFCRNMLEHNKRGYPAINVQEDKRIEFRFFHPCYGNEPLFYHYLEVLGRMIEYYEDPTKKVKLHGGTGTYRQLLDTDTFNQYARLNNKVLHQTLAFSDVFLQFTGHYAEAWKKATRFEPKSHPQQWANKQYRDALRANREKKELAERRRLAKGTAEWLAGDKTSVYDEINMKALRTI